MRTVCGSEFQTVGAEDRKARLHCKKNRVEWGRKLFPRVDIVRVRVEISYLQLFNPSKGRFSYPGLWVLGACTLLGIGGSKETEGGRVHDLGGMSFENGGAWGPIPTIFDENGACFLLNAYDCSQSVTLNLNVSFLFSQYLYHFWSGYLLLRVVFWRIPILQQPVYEWQCRVLLPFYGMKVCMVSYSQ